jgi:hypothetical protein
VSIFKDFPNAFVLIGGASLVLYHESARHSAKSVTKELLLLQKAEAFLMRRFVKARDAYDIYLLRQIGALLNANLPAHLHDAVLGNAFDPESIAERINQIVPKTCEAELKPILPPEIYLPLEEAQFELLRSVLNDLYREWL